LVLTAAEYSSTDGWVMIPRAYLGQPWRLEYTLTDGVSSPVPHEVQWAPEDKLGHLTVPLFGRVTLAPLPIDAGYKVKPTGVAAFTSPEVITTGLWTTGAARIDTGTTVDFDFSSATFLSGKKGRPDPALGDSAFLVDYASGAGDCRVAAGSVMFDSAAVQTGVRTAQIPTVPWDAAKKAVTSDSVSLGVVGRLQSKLGKLHTAVSGNVLFGVAPSLALPGLAAPPRPPALPLALPVMATLLQCPYSPNPGDGHPGTLPATAQPGGLDRFPQVVHVQLVDPRTVLGVTLSSGMETVVAAGQSGFKLDFPAAIPGQPVLTTRSRGAIDLAGDSEQVDAGPASEIFQLSFTPENDTLYRADYHDVVLHSFDRGALTTERIYTVTAPSVRIDGAILRPDTTYVFEIRTYKGHPAAERGDFTQVDYPYGAAIVFTRSFKTAPASLAPSQDR
jgi:hypothetical protein